MLKYILLGFLRLQPSTGYDLHTHMEASTGHFWHAKLSQIYTTLKKLEAENLIWSEVEEQDDRPDKRIYHITEQGQTALENWLGQPNTDMDQLKSTMLLRLFLSGFADLESVITELKLQKAMHEKQLQLYRTKSQQVIDDASQSAPDGDYHKIFWDATRNFGEHYEIMVIAWLTETIEMLTNVKE